MPQVYIFKVQLFELDERGEQLINSVYDLRARKSTSPQLVLFDCWPELSQEKGNPIIHHMFENCDSVFFFLNEERTRYVEVAFDGVFESKLEPALV